MDRYHLIVRMTDDPFNATWAAQADRRLNIVRAAQHSRGGSTQLRRLNTAANRRHHHGGGLETAAAACLRQRRRLEQLETDASRPEAGGGSSCDCGLEWSRRLNATSFYARLADVAVTSM